MGILKSTPDMDLDSLIQLIVGESVNKKETDSTELLLKLFGG